MKRLLLVLVVLGSQFAFGSDNLGQKIEYSTVNGQPRFGLQYAYDSSLVWAFSLSLDRQSVLSATSGAPILWRLWNNKTQKFVSEWKSDQISPGPVDGTVSFSWGLDDKKTAKEAIQSLSFLDVVLAVGQGPNPSPTHYLELGSYCSLTPSKFFNLTTGRAGCDADGISNVHDGSELCTPEQHKSFCDSAYDSLRDKIAKQLGCTFKCK